jgi:hypothetical protein
MMDRIVSAAAAQACKDAVTFPSTPIVLVGARERPLNAAHPGHEQAGENDANKHFADRLHIFSAMLSRGGKADSIPQAGSQPRFHLLTFCVATLAFDFASS